MGSKGCFTISFMFHRTPLERYKTQHLSGCQSDVDSFYDKTQAQVKYLCFTSINIKPV